MKDFEKKKKKKKKKKKNVLRLSDVVKSPYIPKMAALRSIISDTFFIKIAFTLLDC